jgi:hypothetical protein
MIRTPDVLIDLIKLDLVLAHRAGEVHYRAAGKKLLEAKLQVERAEEPSYELLSLIKKDIEDGDRAGQPFFAAAGYKLLEAKPQLGKRFGEWVRNNFRITLDQAEVYMRLAIAAQS